MLYTKDEQKLKQYIKCVCDKYSAELRLIEAQKEFDKLVQQEEKLRKEAYYL